MIFRFACFIGMVALNALEAQPSLEWVPGADGNVTGLFSESNWLDPASGAVPPAGSVDPDVEIHRNLHIRTGTPGAGTGAAGHLRLGTGALLVSNADLLMSESAAAGIYLGGGTSRLTLVDGKLSAQFINGGDVIMKGRSELMLWDSSPLTGSTIDLQSPDSFVYLSYLRPSAVNGSYLTRFKVNGASAVLDSNIVVRAWNNGSVVRLRNSPFVGFRGFEGLDLTGAVSNYSPGFQGAIGQGSATRTNSIYSLWGWGSDIGGTADQFHFVYRSLSGDGEIIARVDSVTEKDAWSKAGVMVRASLAHNSPFVMVAQRPDNQVARISRSASGATASLGSLVGGTTSVKYVRVVRSGDSFATYYSGDGAAGSWIQIGTPLSVSMGAAVYFGLATTSKNGAETCKGDFSNVSILQAGGPAGNDSFGIFSGSQDIYNYWAKDDEFRSFLLKKGFQVTLSSEPAGQGFSKVYIATEKDLAINLPPELDRQVSFMRVLPYRWIARKGWAGSNSPNPNSTRSGAYWNYEWEPTGGSAPDREFVPMIKGRAQNKDYRWEEVRVRADQTHFLGFNEPMSANQGDLTVDEAIALWPKALKLGLRLGSPARTDGSIGDNWLKDFMDKADANGYRVDFVCVHNYNKSTVGALQSWLQAEYNKYGKPIWLTEFQRDTDDNTTAAQHQAYLTAVLPMLESLPFIERYAYYNWGTNSTLFNGDGSLNATGLIYYNTRSSPSYLTPAGPDWCSVEIVSPSDNSTLTGSGTHSLKASVTLPPAAINRVDFYANDTWLGSDSESPYQVDLSGISSGLHTLRAVAITSFGEAASSPSVQITRVIPANTPPALVPVGARTTIAGVALSIPVSAMDPDIPVQSLTYALIDAPAGSAIDPVSGTISWRPRMAQAGSAYTIQVRVTDDGSPPLAADTDFPINVLLPRQPAVGGKCLSSGTYQLTIDGDAGPDYTIEASPDLKTWKAILVQPTPSLPFSWSDPESDDFPNRFYRVFMGP